MTECVSKGQDLSEVVCEVIKVQDMIQRGKR